MRQIKRSLNYLGYYIPLEDIGITDDNDDAFQDSLKAFQRAHMVPFDDRAGPDTVTERILNEELDRLPGNALYTWYTVGDEKVRGEHARRDGLRFTWDAPPEGGHPGEDYNCRCWAEPLNPSRHVWAEWARKQGKIHEARSATIQNLAPSNGLNNELTDLKKPIPLDTINPTWSPFDFIGVGGAVAARTAARMAASKLAARQLAREAAKRDVSWIRNIPKSQLQKKFKHAKDFGIKENQNNKTLYAYKKALEKHVRSPDTIEKSGKLHGENVTHYYDPKTHLNVMKDGSGNFRSAWKLERKQIQYMETTGNLGGGKK